MEFDDFILMDDDDDIIELVDVVDDDDLLTLEAAVEEDSSAVVLAAASEEEKEKDPLTTATLAEIYISQGFLKRALKIYRDLADADPSNELYRDKLLHLKTMIDEDEAQAREEAQSEPVFSLGEFTMASVAEETAGIDGDVRQRVAVLEGWLDNIRRVRECRYGNC